ncbi:MAG: rod shape-determining protein RodA [Alphaproteobacteria bacterium]|nr:rod shape-determining protein RodA [Alphaproteobacteria bacterium]
MSFFKDQNCYLKNYNLSFKEKWMGFDWSFLFFIGLAVLVGLSVLYSIGDGHWAPLVTHQLACLAISLGAFFLVAFFNLRFFMKYAYVFYAIGLVLLVWVAFFGKGAMGAQRWINLGFMQLQPSEIMKVVLVMALARYFHGASLDQIRSIKFIVPPALMVLVPVLLILKQPDLGTALMLVFASCAIFFLVGVQIWKFILLGILSAAAAPIIWFSLHDYQKQRVLTFLNAEADPRGAGYHIAQSKITLGSGGFWGKGFMEGTQRRLSFIPEKHTDFIFTVFAEEFGWLGSIIVYGVYAIIIAYGFSIAMKCTNFFGKILTLGLTTNFALYLFINMAMIMGLMPVVGVPFPLMSYGGTAMLTLFIGFGLMECANINREMVIGRLGSIDDE